MGAGVVAAGVAAAAAAAGVWGTSAIVVCVDFGMSSVGFRDVVYVEKAEGCGLLDSNEGFEMSCWVLRCGG